jgi:hypothetical protein
LPACTRLMRSTSVGGPGFPAGASRGRAVEQNQARIAAACPARQLATAEMHVVVGRARQGGTKAAPRAFFGAGQQDVAACRQPCSHAAGAQQPARVGVIRASASELQLRAEVQHGRCRSGCRRKWSARHRGAAAARRPAPGGFAQGMRLATRRSTRSKRYWLSASSP